MMVKNRALNINKITEFIQNIREDDEYGKEYSNSDVLENFLDDLKGEIEYYSNESGYALISPEWDGEYEVYQETLKELHKLETQAKFILFLIKKKQYND